MQNCSGSINLKWISEYDREREAYENILKENKK